MHGHIDYQYHLHSIKSTFSQLSLPSLHPLRHSRDNYSRASTFVVDLNSLEHPDDIKKDEFGKWVAFCALHGLNFIHVLLKLRMCKHPTNLMNCVTGPGHSEQVFSQVHHGLANVPAMTPKVTTLTSSGARGPMRVDGTLIEGTTQQSCTSLR